MPVPHHRLTLGPVTVLTFGKPHDWSLNRLQTQHDLRNGEVDLFNRVRAALTSQGVSTAYAPRLRSFNARLAEEKHFPVAIKRSDFTLMRGVDASGMVVPDGAAVLFPTGDCPTVVMHDPVRNDTLAFHAGLGELVNLRPFGIDSLSPVRNYDSAICPAAAHFDPQVRRRVLIHVLCGISAEKYRYPTNHPLYGHTNAKLKLHIAQYYGADVFQEQDIAAGAIDLAKLVASQAAKYGFAKENVFRDEFCTATDAERWHSNAARKESSRNMVMVINRG